MIGGRRHLRPVQWAALAFACIWGVALPIAACLVPAYSSTSVTGSGAAPDSGPGSVDASVTITHESATLLAENGASALLIAAVPLAVALAVAWALWHRSRDKSGAGPVAWSFTGLSAAANLVAMLSIGVFIVPVTICLVVACSGHQTRPAARGGPQPAMLGR